MENLPFILFLLALQGFGSSSETALFSLNRFQLRKIRERHPTSYPRIKKLLANPTRLFILILLITEFVGVTISSIVTHFVSTHFQYSWIVTTILSSLISLSLILIFGEITPKVIAAKMNRVVSILNSKPLAVLSYILSPILWPADKIIRMVLQRFLSQGKDPLSRTTSILSEDDLLAIMEQGQREGTVDPSEKAMIKRVLDLDDRNTSDVMTPIQKAFSVSSQAPLSEVISEIRSQKYSRIPVYQKSRKHIVGVLYVKDLLEIRKHPQHEEVEVKSLMTKPLYVSPDAKLSALFRRLKSQRVHMAICVNNDDEAVGVITMEDVLESIFGEIEDETDVEDLKK